jgi:hypothetical protein
MSPFRVLFGHISNYVRIIFGAAVASVVLEVGTRLLMPGDLIFLVTVIISFISDIGLTSKELRHKFMRY